MSNEDILGKLRGLVTSYDQDHIGIQGMLDRSGLTLDGMRLASMAAHTSQEDLVARIRVVLHHIDEDGDYDRWIGVLTQSVERKVFHPGEGSSTNPISNYIDLLTVQFNARVYRILCDAF